MWEERVRRYGDVTTRDGCETKRDNGVSRFFPVQVTVKEFLWEGKELTEKTRGEVQESPEVIL